MSPLVVAPAPCAAVPPATWNAALRGGAARVGRAEALAGLLPCPPCGAVALASSPGPAAPITALRETSVAFAAPIRRFALGERLTPRRCLARAPASAGAAAVATAG